MNLFNFVMKLVANRTPIAFLEILNKTGLFHTSKWIFFYGLSILKHEKMV